MAKKPALPYSPLAVALMVEKYTPCKEAWTGGRNDRMKILGTPLSKYVMLQGNRKLKGFDDLRKILRNVIEPEPGLENNYLLMLEKAEKMMKKDTEAGFSITIKGAGTKQQVIDALHGAISVISCCDSKQLSEGIEDEGETLIISTDTFESYTGYPIEEGENQ